MDKEKWKKKKEKKGTLERTQIKRKEGNKRNCEALKIKIFSCLFYHF